MYRIFPALISDIPAITVLVNSAYRGEQSKTGWTTEAELISGTIRIDEQELERLLKNPDSAILICRDGEGSAVGSVYLEKKEMKLYLGMLSVSPALQGAGIGKKLLVAAEDFAKDRFCESIFMTVISRRTELIEWYIRHGYRDTGEKRPFPAGEKFGKALVPLEFIVLEKPVK